MSANPLTISSLTKRYSGKVVLDGLSLTLESGHIYALISDAGAGKTTLLRCIAGLYRPDSGSITIAGVENGPQARKNLGALVGEPALIRDLSIRGNLHYQSRLLGTVPKGRISTLMKALEITPRDTGSRSIGGCPAALKLKCAIAVALLNSPELLLLDNVYSGLDTDSTVLFRTLIETEMQLRPMAVLMTGNFASEHYPLATDYLLLQGGKIVSHITKEDIMAALPDEQPRSAELETLCQSLLKGAVK